MKNEAIRRSLSSRVSPLATALASTGLAFAAYGGWRAMLPTLWKAGLSGGSSGTTSNLCGMLMIFSFAALLALLAGNSHILCRLERAAGRSLQAFLIRGLRALMIVAHAAIWISPFLGPGFTSALAFRLTGWCFFAAFVALFQPPKPSPLPEAQLVTEEKRFR